VDITFRGAVSQLGLGLPLVTFGTRSATTVMVEPDGVRDIRFVLKGPNGSTTGSPVPVTGSRVYRFSIITDQNLDSVSVTSYRGTLLSGYSPSHGRVTVHTLQSGPGKSPLPVTVAHAKGSAPNMSLCRSLSR
jgi:hypothetical protein